jgi:hypothetical protein
MGSSLLLLGHLFIVQNIIPNKCLVFKDQLPHTDRPVGITTIYELDGQSSIHSRGKRFFFSPQCPHRLWGPTSLLSNDYQGLFPQESSGQGVKLHLVLRAIMVELFFYTPKRLHGVVLN